MICRAGDEPATKSDALHVLMATLEDAAHPKALANTKNFAFTRCGELNLYGMLERRKGDAGSRFGIAVWSGDQMLNRAVKKPPAIPANFMFQLTAGEADVLRYQIGTSKKGRGGRRTALLCDRTIVRVYVNSQHGWPRKATPTNSFRTFIAWADTIAPMILVGETATGPTQDRYVQLFRRRDDIMPQTARVRDG
jgi:hypothetical protein